MLCMSSAVDPSLHKRRVNRRAIQHDLTLRKRLICLCTYTDFANGHYLKVVRCCPPVLRLVYSIAEQYVWRMGGERYVVFSFDDSLTPLGGCFVSISSLSTYVLSEIIECHPIYLANGVSRNSNHEPCVSFFPRSYLLVHLPSFIPFPKTQKSPMMEKPWRAFRREEEWKYGVLHRYACTILQCHSH